MERQSHDIEISHEHELFRRRHAIWSALFPKLALLVVVLARRARIHVYEVPDTDVILAAFVAETGNQSRYVIDGVGRICNVLRILVAIVAAVKNAVPGTDER